MYVCYLMHVSYVLGEGIIVCKLSCDDALGFIISVLHVTILYSIFFDIDANYKCILILIQILSNAFDGK